MKWVIPAKTFLLGEYVAMGGGPAIVLTTSPCFDVSLSEKPGCFGIHNDSPAGVFWSRAAHHEGLLWSDPYQGRGGMGASSAQFLGAYLADAYRQKKTLNSTTMLAEYMRVAWSGAGLRPSGYDVLAQASEGCVFIHQEQACYTSHAWDFHDLAFILVHTGQKLATHDHLKHVQLPESMVSLASLVLFAREAFQRSDGGQLIDAVNAYQAELSRMRLVAPHTQDQLDRLSQEPHLLAMKGCGAMGADVLLLLVPSERLVLVADTLSAQGYSLLATSEQLHQGPGFLL